MKKRILVLTCVVLSLLLCVLFSSCGQGIIKDDTIEQGYFDFTSVETEDSQGNQKITCTVNCVLPIYEYTATLVLVDASGNEFYRSEPKTVLEKVEANQDFYVEFYETNENCKKAEIFRLKINGKSEKRPSSLAENSYNVKYLVGETVVFEDTVKGLTKLPSPSLESKEYLIFDGWYFEPEFMNKCNISSHTVVRDTTLYGKYIFDAEKVSHRVASYTLKSAVSIRSDFYEDQLSFAPDYALDGSGIVYKIEDGYAYVLTNSHVVTYEKAVRASFIITDHKGNTYSAHIYNGANSPEYDLAILRFRVGTRDIEPITFASEDIKKGEVVLSIGSPGSQHNTVTYGRVYDVLKAGGEVALGFKVIYHSAIIGEGSSGGALLNGDLELVGINFAGYASEGMGNGLSVPLSKIQQFISEAELSEQ